MELLIGTRVIDSNGDYIGTVGHIMRDTWSGEVKKYMVLSGKPTEGLMFSPNDIADISNDQVRLRVSTDTVTE